MIMDGNESYDAGIRPGENKSRNPVRALAAEAAVLNNSRAPTFHKKCSLMEGPTGLRVPVLARRVGYLQVEPYSHRRVLDTMPKQSYRPSEVIPRGDFLCVIERGSIQIRHARDKYPVKEMATGGVFGEMPSLGQTMSVTEAVAGASGVTLTIMNAAEASRWIAAEPHWLLRIIGPRLWASETDLYRAQFQSPTPRVAGLLLRLAGGGAVIEVVTHKALGEMIGMYREIVSLALRELRASGIIETERKRIAITNKEALIALSEF